MATLQPNARRLRRKFLSSRLGRAAICFVLATLVLFFYSNRKLFIPAGAADPLHFNTTVKDPTINWTRVAYVQHVASPDDLCQTVMLFSELDETYSLAQRVLLYPSSWSINAENNTEAGPRQAEIARLLRLAVDEFRVVLTPSPVLNEVSNNGVWRGEFTKFLAYNLTQYERVITIGHESAILNAMDELFFIPPAPLALPQVYWPLQPPCWRLSSQLLVMQPSVGDFQNLERAIRAAGSRYETDVDLLQGVFNDTLIRIPQRPYHVLTEEFQRKDNEHAAYLGSADERWDVYTIMRESRLVNFFDPPLEKPWGVANGTWNLHRPKCVPTAYHRMDCAISNAWARLYGEYDYRRKNVCGAGFEP